MYALPRRLDSSASPRLRDRARIRLGCRPQSRPSSDPLGHPQTARCEPTDPRSLSCGDHTFGFRTNVPLSLWGDRARSGGTSQPDRAMQRRLTAMVLWYQEAFQWRPSPCRFTPSCSNYALEAIESHGSARGLWLTICRLLRCRPFGPSGFDPVPEPHDHSHSVELT